MHTVSFETAKRLAEAGFPQPEQRTGQTWYDGNEVPFVEGHSGPTESDTSVTIFAPTATDIMRELQGWALVFLFDTIKGEGAWFFWLVDTPALCFTHHSNPAEAAAEAWLYENDK